MKWLKYWLVGNIINMQGDLCIKMFPKNETNF
jgi:hypothetical protein